jgi:carbonic anhydrase
VLQRASADPQSDCEQESVRLSLENLLTFPWIADRVAEHRLQLTGTIFDIRSGVLALLQADGAFVPVPAHATP